MYFRDIEVADFSDPPPNFKFGLSGTLTGGVFSSYITTFFNVEKIYQIIAYCEALLVIFLHENESFMFKSMEPKKQNTCSDMKQFLFKI